jgi:hypothetical protein
MHESDPGSRVPPTHVPPPGSLGESAGPHTLQILMTEHWSLLAHRGFLYTESLGRTSIFVAALTGSVVALALVAQATDVGDSFVAFALVLLPVVYFLGVVTFVRLLQVNWEDTRWVQGMNRIRHAYLDLAPELDSYFVTSKYDDDMGILQSAVAMRRWPSPAQVFVTVPGVVGVIDSVVAGAIAGIAAVALDLRTGWALALGGVLFLVSVASFVALGDRQIERFRAELDPVFPSPPREG